jgi:uncharacterized protein YcsI (UPF0317 family)
VKTQAAFATGADVRRAAREGSFAGQTSGLAYGFVQGNLAILPSQFAADFLEFCRSNPKPCPLIGVSEPGDYRLPSLGADIDLRTDVPRYRIWRDGSLVDEPTDIRDHWRDDLVAFVLGCSFSFEEALLDEGIPLKHIAAGINVAMYRTNVPCEPAGPFAGPLVVSMRPFTPQNARRAVAITSRYPAVHGAPVHLGDPSGIGIRDLSRPDYGDAVDIAPDEIPVFWACGVTPQAVITAARIPFAITHAPGCMLVTDMLNRDLRSPK